VTYDAAHSNRVDAVFEEKELDKDAAFHEDEAATFAAAETRRHPAATQTSPGDLPRVVRGSILIRNSIDTTGTPRHIDVVTADSDAPSEATVVVEDNTNMFHGLYRQSRENPIYLSDPEASADDDDVEQPAASNSGTSYISKKSRLNERREDRRQNATLVVDDFDKNIKITRGKYEVSVSGVCKVVIFDSFVKCRVVCGSYLYLFFGVDGSIVERLSSAETTAGV